MNLETQFKSSLQRIFVNKDNNAKYLCAVSGGIDSLALCYLLKENNVAFKAIIIDHNLRPEAKQEAKTTLQILSKLNIDAEIIVWQEGSNVNTNIQEQAREARYNILTNYAKTHDYAGVFVGQHKDDLLETFFMRLSRGSGLAGLSCFSYISQFNEIDILRPLLDFSKNELKTYLEHKKIHWVEDPSNATDKYDRNRMRMLLAEFLQDENISENRLVSSILNIARANNYIEDCVRKEVNNIFKQGVKLPLNINYTYFINIHDEIKFRLYNAIIKTYKPSAKNQRMEKLINLNQALLNKQKHELAGLTWQIEQNNLIIS